jgi:hypothetical protein
MYLLVQIIGQNLVNHNKMGLLGPELAKQPGSGPPFLRIGLILPTDSIDSQERGLTTARPLILRGRRQQTCSGFKGYRERPRKNSILSCRLWAIGEGRSVTANTKFDWFNWFRWSDWLIRLQLAYYSQLLSLGATRIRIDLYRIA